MLKSCLLLFFVVAVGFTGCSYRYYAEDLQPLSESDQGENKEVSDDGSVTYNQARLAITLRPMTDEELNRQFSAYSNQGANSPNPYTFGNSEYFRTGDTPQRWTVFKLNVSNYEYSKVYLDPEKVYITTSNGRKYYAVNREQLSIYYRRYAGGVVEVTDLVFQETLLLLGKSVTVYYVKLCILMSRFSLLKRVRGILCSSLLHTMLNC